MSLKDHASQKFTVPRYLSITIPFGRARFRFDNIHPRFTAESINQFVGLKPELNDEMEILADTDDLIENAYSPHTGETYYLLKEKRLEDAENVFVYVKRNYSGRATLFNDEFDDEDLQILEEKDMEILDYL